MSKVIKTAEIETINKIDVVFFCRKHCLYFHMITGLLTHERKIFHQLLSILNVLDFCVLRVTVVVQLFVWFYIHEHKKLMHFFSILFKYELSSDTRSVFIKYLHSQSTTLIFLKSDAIKKKKEKFWYYPSEMSIT